MRARTFYGRPAWPRTPHLHHAPHTPSPTLQSVGPHTSSYIIDHSPLSPLSLHHVSVSPLLPPPVSAVGRCFAVPSGVAEHQPLLRSLHLLDRLRALHPPSPHLPRMRLQHPRGHHLPPCHVRPRRRTQLHQSATTSNHLPPTCLSHPLRPPMACTDIPSLLPFLCTDQVLENDVWYSTDGFYSDSHLIQPTSLVNVPGANFTHRRAGSAVYLNNGNLVWFGGKTGLPSSSHIASPAHPPLPPFSPPSLPHLTHLPPPLCPLLCVDDPANANSGQLNSVYYSSDQAFTWYQATGAALWSARSDITTCVPSLHQLHLADRWSDTQRWCSQRCVVVQ